MAAQLSNTPQQWRFQFHVRVTTYLPALAACLALACGCLSCKKAQGAAQEGRLPGRGEAVPVTTEKVASVPLDRTLPIVGTLYAKDEATIAAEVEGRIERTVVDFGDRVKAGQEIALVNTSTYEAAARQADANIARARAMALVAEKELKRARSLGAVASQADIDTAESASEQANAEVKAAEAADAIARLNLDRSHVRAPFDGAIAERVGSAGDFVKAGTPLFRIVNDQVLKFIAQAPERHAAQVKKEMPVVFTVDAFPDEKFEGRVFLISPQITAATRSFAFGALVANAGLRLRANTFARGELLLERAVPTPMVPLEAIVNFAGVSKVFVLVDGAARSREVQVGRVVAGRQEVLAGLKPEDTVILSGQTKLYDGTKVRLKAPTEPVKTVATAQ